MEGAGFGWWIDGVGGLRLDLLARLLLAAVLGGLIGLEREISGKPAGFRTNLLICVGATLLTELSIGMARLADPTQTNADPARIAAQIVSGIGFLGAGTIIQARGSVVGLTTAATLWVVAAIGMAVGARAYVEAVGTTILVIAALIFLGRVEDVLIRRRSERMLQVTVEPDPTRVQELKELFERAGFDTRTLEVEKGREAFVASFVTSGPRARWDELYAELLRAPGVHKITQL